MSKSSILKSILFPVLFIIFGALISIPSRFSAQSQGSFTPTPTTLPPPQLVESDSASVYREGQWINQSTASAGGGGYLYSSGSENILKLGFQGTSVTITYIESPSFGSFAVEIDHTVVRTVIATNEDTHFGVQTTVDYLEPGYHFLHVYPVQGTVGIDAFTAAHPFAPILIPPPDLSPGSVPLEELPPDEGGAAGVGSYIIHIEVETAEELVQAIISANTVIKHHFIHLAPGVYTFTEGMSPTVTESALQITGKVTLIGSGGIDPETGNSLYPNEMLEGSWSILEKSGDNDISILDITATGSVTLYNILIRDGGSLDRMAGGGIRNSGYLTIYNSRIEENQSGVFGGGLWNNGVAKISNTEFRNNEAIDTNDAENFRGGSGGSAIANEDTATLRAYCTTFENNLVNPTTGLVPGGAIYSTSQSSQITVQYSNFVNNQATGTNRLCSELPLACPIHIRDVYSSATTWMPYNYWSNPSNGSVQNVYIDGAATAPINYGEHAETGQPCYVPPPPQASEIIVTTVAYEFNEDGDCSLTEAIAAANRNIVIDGCASGTLGDADTITLAPVDGNTFDIPDDATYSAVGGGGRMLYPATPNPTGSPMQISSQVCDSAHRDSSIFCVLNTGAALQEAVTITGAYFNINLLVAPSQQGKRLFYVAANAKLTLENVAVVGFRVAGNGGAILNDGTVEIKGSTIYRNRATGNGGAIYNSATAKLTVQDSRIYQNTSLGKGGAVYDTGSGTGDVIENTCIFNNAAPLGGGVYLDSSDLGLNNNYWDIPGLYDANNPNKPLDDPNTIYGGAIPQSQSGPCPTASNLPGVIEPEACYVRPLLYSLHNQLYGVDGRAQVAKDMRSIIDPNLPQSGGLLAHYGPTINSPINRGDNLAQNPVKNGYERFPWNYGHIPVLYRAEFESNEGGMQIWYYVTFAEPHTPTGTTLTLDGAWIVARMDDVERPELATDRFFYVEGVGITDNSDPCRAYVPTVNDPTDPSFDPTFSFQFPYNRQRALEYGIAHAYQSELHSPPQRRVTQRLNSTLPNFPTTEINVARIPFANFEVDVNHGLDPNAEAKTGSAVYVSEVFWMGGLPMTWDVGANVPGAATSCGYGGSDTTTRLDSGWRHCTLNGEDAAGGNHVWVRHQWLMAYYTQNILPFQIEPDVPLTSLSINSKGHAVPPPSGLVPKPSIATVDLELYGNPDYGIVFNPAGLSNYMVNQLVVNQPDPIEGGDYVWIDSFVREPENEDTSQNTTHGLVVAGWGEAVNCDNVLNPITGTRVFLGQGLYIKQADASSAGIVNPVPYVIDFGYQLQQPIPRPFYCTTYMPPRYEQASGYATNTWLVFVRPHDWYFFAMPDMVSVDVLSLFVDLDWRWGEQDGQIN